MDNPTNLITINLARTNEIIEKIKIEDTRPLFKEIMISFNPKFDVLQKNLNEVGLKMLDTNFSKFMKNNFKDIRDSLEKQNASLITIDNSLNGETGFLFYFESLQQNMITGNTFNEFSSNLFNLIKKN
jgi:hypothetical protein